MTKEVKLGYLKVGRKNPVRIKGMLKTSIDKPRGLIREAKRLEAEGAEAIRMAVRQEQDIKLFSLLKKHISLPIVADIHFHPKFAILAIKEGFEGIRLNPLNIPKKKDAREIAQLAKHHKVSIRVGINSGGFKKDFSSPKKLAQAMVGECLQYLRVLEAENFFDIMVSLKSSDVRSTLIANELLSDSCGYPIHLGITASGLFFEGLIKSSIGLGSLLYRGIGDIIRVSLTAPSHQEIRVAKHILQSLGLRRFDTEVISCPTCSRCEVNLINIVDKFKKELQTLGFNKPIRIAIMGCVVNGPGEAYQADIGVAFGKKKAAIFRKSKILGWSTEKRIIKDLMKEVRRIWI